MALPRSRAPAAVSFAPGSDVLPRNPAEQGPGAASAHVVAIEAADEHVERRVGRRAEGPILEQRAGGFEQETRVVLGLPSAFWTGRWKTRRCSVSSQNPWICSTLGASILTVP